jgi:hypothetical protein
MTTASIKFQFVIQVILTAETPAAYIPMDRLQALARNVTLPDRVTDQPCLPTSPFYAAHRSPDA